MINFDILKKLNKAKFIFYEPIMSGHYVWRSRGIKFVNNIYTILSNELSSVKKIEHIQCGSIIKMKDYNYMYKNVSDYKNVFSSVNYDYVIRPENTSVLIEALNKNRNSIIMVNTPLYRQFQPKAFLIDQRIWPAPSFCLNTNKKILANTINDIISSLNLFFDKMFLPYLWIEQKQGFKKFAEWMFLPLMPENSKTLTIASTLYVLSDIFSDKSNIDEKIIQYGFSERLIYIYCVMQENKSYTIWPSTIAPFNLLITEDIEEYMKDYKEKIRYKIFKSSGIFNEDIKMEDPSILQEGCPVILFKNKKEIFYKLVFTGETGKLTNFKMIGELFQKSDFKILENNKKYFEKCLKEYKVAFLCEKCENKLESFLPLGSYYPEIFSNCEMCGINNSPKKIFLPSNTNKSINEKLIKIKK
jgi:hypothetical protein